MGFRLPGSDFMLSGKHVNRPDGSGWPKRELFFAHRLTDQKRVCYNLHAGHGQMFCGTWYPWYPLTPEIGDTGWKWWKQWEPWRTRKDTKYAGFQQT